MGGGGWRGYFNFWLRKRKIVPLAGFPNAWPTEFPGNGVGSLTICFSMESLMGGGITIYISKSKWGALSHEKIIAKNETFVCRSEGMW